MKIIKEYFSVNTPSARLLTYLRQYFETGLNNEAKTSGENVLVEDLSKFVSENIKEKFPYPMFVFYILTDVDFAVSMISQDKNKIRSSKKVDGELRIIDTGSDECSMEFSIYNEGFIAVENKIIEHLSVFWKIKKGSVVSRIVKDPPQEEKERNQTEYKLGEYIKTVNYPRKYINTSNKEPVAVNPLSSSNVKFPNERNGEEVIDERENSSSAKKSNKDEWQVELVLEIERLKKIAIIEHPLQYDYYAVARWNHHDDLSDICGGILKTYGIKIGRDRLINRMSKLRNLYPQFEIIKRNEIKC